PSDIEVVHLGEQIAARGIQRPPSRLGIVAVVRGQGLARIVADLGALAVDGAAGELPSVADLLDAAREVDAEQVVILPGHRNTLATARQALEVARSDGMRP